ncbi:MAG: hypothetical protein KC502_13035 [Myxococcales bacterium]|nr:hypothetical protein [Myxococcales bacterium]
MHGDVFSPRLTIPRVVAWALANSSTPLHIQNLARPGASVAEWHDSALATVLSAPKRYKPRAIMIYVGHNGYPDTLDHDWYDAAADKDRKEVERQYDKELRTLITRAQSAGAKVIIGIPTANIEGHPPPGPRHRAGTSPDTQLRYERAISAAERHLVAQNFSEALYEANRAAKLSAKHAWAPFLRGRALRGLGRRSEAVAAFSLAHKLDLDRQRALPSQNAVLTKICAQGLARCIDAGGAMRSEFNWLDDDAFIDLHHPNARGHLLIGLAYARVIADTLQLPAPRAKPPIQQWPAALNPAPLMRERFFQTFAWYLQLAARHRDGYPRAFRDALVRGRACLNGLQPHRSLLSGKARDEMERRLRVAEVLLAATAGEVDKTRSLMAIVWKHTTTTTTHPLRQPWMRSLVGSVIGDDVNRPATQK